MPEDTPPDHKAPHRDRLIESIYRIALEPQTYDSFMGEWDSYIGAQMAQLASLESQDLTQATALSHPEVLAHFKIAAQLLDHVGRPLVETGKPQSNAGRDLQILIDSHGRIAWSTGAAAYLFNLKQGARIDRLAVADGQLAALKRMTFALQGKQGDHAKHSPVLLQITTANSKDVIHMVARIVPDQASEDVIIITKVAPDWPPAMPRLLREGFALSPAEIEICEQIADGQSSAGIATLRGNAVATVRTHFKRIMAKTHCKAQPELVQLLHSVMRVADQDTSGLRRHWSKADRISAISLPERTMPVEHFGDPMGYPVVFFHGMLNGNAMTSRMREELKRHNLRLICPVRPYFGNAAGSPGPALTAPDRFGRDVARLIDELGLKKPIFLGHMAGILYAYAAANAQPKGRIPAILSVSGGVPIISRDQFASMSRRQRLVAYTARYTPAILPFVLRAGISQIDNGGERQFLHSLYENAPDDLPLIADPEIRDLIFSGYRFSVQQGPKAFEIDSFNAVQDWSALVDGSEVPIRMLMGETDPVISVSSVRDFTAKRAERVSLEVLQGAGQLILFSDPDRIIREICALRDGG